MDDDAPGRKSKPNQHAVLSREALFRHHVMSEIRARVLAGHTLAAAIGKVLTLPHQDHHGPRKLSKRTLYRWLAAFSTEDYAGLEPKTRSTIADSEVLPRKFLDFLRLTKQDKNEQDTSIPELIRRARRRGVLDQDEAVDRTSVWRACRRMGLPVTRRQKLAQTDMRRFAYPHRMLMGLADGKQFRAGVHRRRRVGLFLLDDATRYGLDVVVGTTEDTKLFLEGLYAAISGYGLMSALFLDNGSGFISDDTETVAAHLRVLLIHGTSAYPEGHGKIERFNQTCLHQLLRGLDRSPEVDSDPTALRLRLRHYLHEIYNHTPHEGLAGQTPAQRFASDPRPLNFPADRAWLDACFVTTLERTVSKDNVISYQGQIYEVPRGHARQRLTIHRHLLQDDALFVFHEGREVRLHTVDLAANAHTRRARPHKTKAVPQDTPPSKTAATLAFEGAFSPLVGSDGGYPEGDDHDPNDDPDPDSHL